MILLYLAIMLAAGITGFAVRLFFSGVFAGLRIGLTLMAVAMVAIPLFILI